MAAGQAGKKNLPMNQSIKIVVYVAGFIALFSNASAQEIKWDSTYRPAIYPLQVDLFRAAHHSKSDIVFLGNSITFWANWGELLHSKRIKDRGIPGDISFGVLDRLDEVIGGRPKKVFILIGINDIARNIPDSVVLRNYRRIIRAIKKGSPRTKIFFQSILPVNPSFGKSKAHYKKDHIRNINAGLKKITEEENVGFIDLHAAFADADDNLPANLSFDGVHLVKAGYDKWVSILREGGYLKK
jgi:lysophospholipase L1-like esterase